MLNLTEEKLSSYKLLASQIWSRGTSQLFAKTLPRIFVNFTPRLPHSSWYSTEAASCFTSPLSLELFVQTIEIGSPPFCPDLHLVPIVINATNDSFSLCINTSLLIFNSPPSSSPMRSIWHKMNRK